ncbi:N-terminal double-transmembrane domain-containing protein [Monaibacterium marinum]|uniref:N-terminal double-transmembrane domain-containing protein n=1 Tax=Pontivivens marinum TaxID=1690039 RepID=A0A2C9CUL0_9RHOB|nr:DUF4159 domain-containing protein [Monaibacterium marinum]SOH95201.1 N-terminal double-transmembrane domain-containing protein [Monaibacterium marinum]
MLSLGAIGFVTPLLLAALVALPALWWLLRATPPAPVRRMFPGISLLLGLQDAERMPARTPWWLLALRIAMLAMAILGLSGPLLNPASDVEQGDGALLIVMDGGWASASNWSARRQEARQILQRAGRSGRAVHLVSLADAEPDLAPRAAADWLGVLDDMQPMAWAPDRAGFAEQLDALDDIGASIWITDGLGDDGGLPDALAALGRVEVVMPTQTALALAPARFEDGQLVTHVLRAPNAAPQVVPLQVIGTDAAGVERVLDQVEVTLGADEVRNRVAIDLPLELRNRVTRLVLAAPYRSAGATVLTDDALQRRRIALVSSARSGEGQSLTEPLHYLRTALTPVAEVVEPLLSEVLDAAPDIVMLADVANFSDDERNALQDWVRDGGMLVRFAGPRMAASTVGQMERDPLLPVRLREGGRNLGGAMSWGDPKRLRPFPQGTLFDGLALPEDVDVVSQVMAQPDPDLAERTLVALEDGTPLVTARDEGRGRVILFHVTATPRWSSLPLSGLFLEMLDRIARVAQSGEQGAQALTGAIWTPERVLNGMGDIMDVQRLAGVSGERLADAAPAPDAPPGLYRAGVRGHAYNVTDDATSLQALELPAGIASRGYAVRAEQDLTGPVLAGALILLLVDILATLALGGRLRPAARAGMTGLALMLFMGAQDVKAQSVRDDPGAIYATSETVLAYIRTGDVEVDRISRAGLTGLSTVLTQRTAIEPAPPVAVDIERDELAFYPLLYWPITDAQAPPGPEAVVRINTYLRSGGMILFDTRDTHLAGGSEGPGNAQLRRLAGQLDLPSLERIPADHVMTRAFYLLDDYPGRYVGAPVWAEASLAPVDLDGVPFRNLNDGVSPVIIGGNDWAGAWAMDDQGSFIRPVGRGVSGERQREMAFRFGVNLVMYVMTGNYKSDQVHVPALLERLGQ